MNIRSLLILLMMITCIFLVCLCQAQETSSGMELNTPKLTVIYPSYRNQIQSKDRTKEIRVRIDTGLNPRSKVFITGSIVNCSSEITTEFKATLRVHSDGYCEYAKNVSHFKPDEYTVKLGVRTESGILLEQQIPLNILPPAPYEVTFDHRRICYINGIPYFPIGIYHLQPAVFSTYIKPESEKRGLSYIDWRQALSDVKDRGFNTVVHAWGFPSEEFLAEANKRRLSILPEGATWGDRANFVKLRDLANKYNNIPMWYGVDEPYEAYQIEIGKRFYSDIAQVEDPHRAVGTAVGMIKSISPIIGSIDVILPDYYTIRYITDDYFYKGLTGKRVPDLSEYAWAMEETIPIIEAAGKPMWSVPQSFDSGSGPMPRPEELKCQAYISLVNGATGIIWYAYFTDGQVTKSKRGPWYLPDYPALWDYFPKLNSEVSRFGKVIVASKSTSAIKWSDPRIKSRSWATKSGTYIVAVNPMATNIHCNLPKPPGQNAAVWDENRTLQTKSGVLNDSFAPYEVHIYEFDK